MKVLILNLTRFGDLLQTSPTIVGLRATHPDAHVTVCVDRNFGEVCRGLPGVDRVWEIELDRLGRLLLEPGTNGLRAAYHTVEELVTALQAERFDLALNYSSSRMSAVLMGLLRIPDTRGWTMTADGHRLIAHRWSRLFSTSALNRRFAPFNLVDYYQRVAGVAPAVGPRRLFFTVAPEARARATALLREGGWTGEPLIALQLGASRDMRRWPATSFAALARALAVRIGARIVLCGGAGDRTVGDEVAGALGGGAIDACGRTTVGELAGVLEQADVLVTGDTGPMHLAVALGTPVVALFFGPALPVDTGPYGADHVCLHADVPCAPCDHNVTCGAPFCRETLHPEAVAEAVIARRAADWPALAAAAGRWPSFAWYRTGFDGEGLFELLPLGDRPVARSERVRRAYRALWKATLDGTPAHAAGPALRDEAAVVRELARLAGAAHRLASDVETLARVRGGFDLARLEDAARRLEEADATIVRFGTIHALVTPLTQMFRFEKESLVGEDVWALAAATRELHGALDAQARLLAELLDPSPQPARSRAEERRIHHGSVD